MGKFGRSLLNETDPPISGLDKSVLIPPRRLHFTLGVMPLASTSSAVGMEGTTDPTIQSRTLDDAVRFLESLKPRLDDLLRVSAANQAQKICAALDSMDILKPEKGGAAHVLWVGPKDGNSKNIVDEETKRLRRVCGKLDTRSGEVRTVFAQPPSRSDFIHSSFKEAGFIIEENRPLKVCSFIPFAPFNPSLLKA